MSEMLKYAFYPLYLQQAKRVPLCAILTETFAYLPLYRWWRSSYDLFSHDCTVKTVFFCNHHYWYSGI